jgi:hypothetical protein
MAKRFGTNKSRRERRPKSSASKNIAVEQAQTAKARFHQPKTLVQFFRESPFVGVELDLERQDD